MCLLERPECSQLSPNASALSVEAIPYVTGPWPGPTSLPGGLCTARRSPGVLVGPVSSCELPAAVPGTLRRHEPRFSSISSSIGANSRPSMLPTTFSANSFGQPPTSPPKIVCRPRAGSRQHSRRGSSPGRRARLRPRCCPRSETPHDVEAAKIDIPVIPLADAKGDDAVAIAIGGAARMCTDTAPRTCRNRRSRRPIATAQLRRPPSGSGNRLSPLAGWRSSIPNRRTAPRGLSPSGGPGPRPLRM